MFADDTILFLRISMPVLYYLRSLFAHYRHVSGQQMNYNKCSIIFSANTPPNLRREYSTFLRIGLLLVLSYVSWCYKHYLTL
ncbi:hypothetical protein LINPERPRIM_LOCUS25581 [Linum perenne]